MTDIGQPKRWPGLKISCFLGHRKKNCKCRKSLEKVYLLKKHKCASDIPSCDISENYETIFLRRHSIAKMGWNQLKRSTELFTKSAEIEAKSRHITKRMKIRMLIQNPLHSGIVLCIKKQTNL